MGKKLEIINGYQLTTELTSKNSGFARWGFATKDGKSYFIKEFLAPVYPEEDLPIPDSIRQKRIESCNDFYNAKLKLYHAIEAADRGNIVAIKAFFRHKTHYYIVTDKVDTVSLDIHQIAQLPEDKKLIMLKVLTNNLQNLAQKHVVHGDLKPSNILVKKTEMGFYTVKLIDFDSSYFEYTKFAAGEDINGDTVYMAPEMFLCLIEACDTITVKADVFSLGILFHQYWSGEMPRFSDEYDYLYEVVLDDAEYTLNPLIPGPYQCLIRKMLEKDPEKRIDISSVMAELNHIHDAVSSERSERVIVSHEPVKNVFSERDDGFAPPEIGPEMLAFIGGGSMVEPTYNDKEPGVVRAGEVKKVQTTGGLKITGGLAKTFDR